MKGAGTMISTILIVIIILFFLYLFLLQTADNSQKKLQLNLDSAGLMKAKNTVSILNRSLSTTWYVSTVQMIFRTGYDSVGCGYGDDNNQIDQGYWYEYKNPTQSKILSLPQGAKYNNNFAVSTGTTLNEPRMCYPQDSDIAAYMSAMSSLYTQIPTSVSPNGVNLTISPGSFSFDIKPDHISSGMTEEIKTKSNDPSIDMTTENNNTIYTQMSNMVSSGRNMIAGAANIAQNPSAFQFNEPLQTYLSASKTQISTMLGSSVVDASKIGLSAKVNDEIIASSGSETGLGFTLPAQGLMLNYSADVTITEKTTSSGVSTQCQAPPADIENIVTQYSDVIYLGNSATIGKDDFTALVNAIIQRESNWDPNAKGTPITVAPGITDQALGLMQIVPSYHYNEPACAGDMMDPNLNIYCGTTFLRTLFAGLDKDVPDPAKTKDNMIKLASAAYKYGLSRLESIAKCAGGTYDWDTIVQDYKYCLDTNSASSSPGYVNYVYGCYSVYGSGSSVGGMQWPTPSRAITSCFGYRTLNGQGENHQAIDIGALPGSGPTDVTAAADGSVVDVKADCVQGTAPANTNCGGGFGNYIIVDNGNGIKMRYSHLKEGSITVNVGSVVHAGNKIAEMGSTGSSTGTHLDFRVLVNDVAKNPCNYIDCTQSTGKQCSSTGLDPTLTEGLYYYHNESANTFSPEPFSLNLKIQDTLNIFDCLKNLQPNYIWLQYTFNNPGDMICCGGAVWTCDVTSGIKNIKNHALSEGQFIRDQDGPASACYKAYDQYDHANVYTDSSDQDNHYSLGCQGGVFSDMQV